MLNSVSQNFGVAMLTLGRYSWFTAGGGSPHSSFETITHDEHRLRRGALNPFFSKRSIVSIQDIIVDKIEKLCTLFRTHQGSTEPLNLRVAYSALTLDIISDYCFGASWNCLENDALANEWHHTLFDIFEKANLIMHFPWLLKAINLLPDSIAGPVINHHRVRYIRFDAVTWLMFIQNTRKYVGKILRHEDNPQTTRQNTIFHELRDSGLPPEEKSLMRLSDEGNILIGAGSETTGSTLAVISFHIINNPEVLQKLRTELHAVIPNVDSKVTWQQLEQLPYLVSMLIMLPYHLLMEVPDRSY